MEANFDEIQAWAGAAFDIVTKYVRRRQAGWMFFVLERSEQNHRLQTYFRDPFFAREMRFLQSYPDRKLYRGYHRLATSPLLNLYTISLLGVDEIARVCGRDSSMTVLVDSFNDSHGVDELATVETMRGVASLDRIVNVERVVDGDEVPLLQAADLVGFSRFRSEMYQRGVIKADEALNRLTRRYRNGQTVTSANIGHRVTKRHPNWLSLALTMHYALARAHVARTDEVFATDNLVTVDEFKARLGMRPNGVSVLTKSAYRKMAKTPD